MKVPAFLFACVLMTALMGTVMATRPLMPIDETRYLTVAWEYMARGDWILPTLNFAPYSHKPPMLFWMIDLMWHITGEASIWAARIVPLIAAFGTLFLTRQIGRLLWPNAPQKADIALYLMMGTPFFLIYSTLIMFDTLLTIATLIGIFAILKFYLTGARRWVLLLALAFGLGGLIKGPVILLHLSPVLILWPIVTRPFPLHRGVWYQGLLFALILGVGTVLAWALPAAQAGGPEYERMIFWGQSAGRMVKAFDHARPFWFYLVLLPVLMLPWALMRPLYHRHDRPEPIFPLRLSWQMRFLICWTVPVFVAFMMVSGKQVHYMMPLLPAAMLMLAHHVHEKDLIARVRPLTIYLYGTVPLALILMALMGAELYADVIDTHWISSLAVQIRETHVAPVLIAFLVVLGLGVWLYRRGAMHRPVRTLRVTVTALVVILMGLHASSAPLLARYYDLSPIAAQAEDFTRQGRPLAVIDKWEGEIGYLAHLRVPVDVVESSLVKSWLRTHPRGMVIYRHKAGTPPKGLRVLFTQSYRSPGRAISLVEM